MKRSDLKKLTEEPSFCRAVRRVWREGISALQNKTAQEEAKRIGAKLEEEYLELSRLVHDYETKLHGLVRHNAELSKQNRELEWAHRALRRENRWMKEELLAKRESSQPK